MVNTSGLQKRKPLVKWSKYKLGLVAFLFVLPALLNFTVFRYYPIAWSIRTSLWDYSLLGGFKAFVGFGNYIKAFSDPTFIKGLGITTIYTVFKVGIQVVLALALAVFVSQKKPGMGFARMVIFVPVVISYIVVTVIWGLILNKDYGLLNSMFASVGLPRLEYLTSIKNALPSIIALSVWKDVGYSMIILVAGMKGISDVYYDAAKVDGATGFQAFLHVTLPLLSRSIMFVLVTTTMGAFQVFVPVFSLTQGGPRRSTMVSMYYIYQKAFTYGEMGYAVALSMIVMVLLLVISLIQMRLLRSE